MSLTSELSQGEEAGGTLPAGAWLVMGSVLSLSAAHRQGSASAPAPSSSRSYSTGSASTHKRPSATLIAWELLRTQGLAGLYKGLGATLLR